MKKILLYISLICFFTSCNDIDLLPKDKLTDATYWNTVNDLKLYANNLYTTLPAPGVHHDDQSDDVVTTNYQKLLFNEALIPTAAPNSGDKAWNWNTIRSCNLFLQRYKKAKGAEANINQYVAEVRFFRALDYFAKIKTFGDVPWYDKDLQVSNTEELYKGRNTRGFVLTKIIEDIEFAIQWLPEADQAEVGRLNKDAARLQLARVCLHEGTFRKYHQLSDNHTSSDLLNKAATTAEAIINSGKYQIVKGTDVGCGQKAFENYPLFYSNQFIQEDLVNNKECILARIYQDGILHHSTSRDAGESGSGLSKDFVESFLSKDGLPISVSSLYQGDETLEIEMKNRDPRIYQVIDNTHRPYKVTNGVRQVNPYTNVDPNKGVTGYPCTKFKSPIQAQEEALKTTYDWFVYRYAEVLLIFAEAKTELGECTQNVLDRSINLLRDRVGMPHLNVNPIVDTNPINYGYTISPLLYEIRRERRIELVNEGFRWDDIVRWKAGKLLENPKTFLGIRVTDKVKDIYPESVFKGENSRHLIKYNNNYYLAPYQKNLNEAGRKWKKDDKRYLSPIPSDELLLNEELTQNPHWNN